MNSEHDEFPEEEEEDDAPRSIFAAGWFRAVLILTVLAIGVVVTLPYLLDWFEPLPPPVKAPARAAQSAESPLVPTPATSPPVQREAAPAPGRPAPAPQLSPAAAKPAPGKVRALVPDPPRVASTAQAQPTPLPRVVKATDAAPAASRPTLAAKPGTTRAENLSGYWIQLGLFKDQKNADGLARRLREQGLPVQVAHVTRSEKGTAATAVSAVTYHAVRAGAFPDRQRATAARGDLYQKGYAGFIVERTSK